MPLDTVDRTAPSLFNQGVSPLSKLLVLGAVALVLMVVDARLRLAQPLRGAVATALVPLQWVALGPVRGLQALGQHFSSLDSAQQDARDARNELTRQAQRAAQVEQLTLENRELRQLLEMRERLPVKAQGAEILYDSADPYVRRVVVDRGQTQGVEPGSPVMDGYGVLGQVTRVFPLVSEVTLLTDREQTIPVLNTRTGQRHLAVGLPRQGQLELRFVAGNADIEPGDLLTTSGLDGIYPPGLPVAKVARVTRQAEGGFAQVVCQPMARMEHALQLLVLSPLHHGLPDDSVKPVTKPQAPAGRAPRPGRADKGTRP
jgi:rod shape-determining protein MreC